MIWSVFLSEKYAFLTGQYTYLIHTQHFKDLLNIRRTTGEFLRKRDKDDASQNGDPDGEDTDLDVQFVLSREKCLLAVKGLVALLLSTDFTCHVDLFIVGCKVSEFLSNYFYQLFIHTDLRGFIYLYLINFL